MSSTRSKTELNPDPIDLGSVPHCFSFMQGRILDYIEGESLTIGFPVFRHYLNPSGSMQGGFISAAVDNVFGPLCYSATKTPQTTRPILPAMARRISLVIYSVFSQYTAGAW